MGGNRSAHVEDLSNDTTRFHMCLQMVNLSSYLNLFLMYQNERDKEFSPKTQFPPLCKGSIVYNRFVAVALFSQTIK